MPLTTEQILAASPKLKEVEVPEWGGAVFIRPVTLEEQGMLADLGSKHEKSSAAIRIRHCTLSLLQWTVCDEDGKPLFTGEDLAGLMSKSSASAFLRLQDAVQHVSVEEALVDSMLAIVERTRNHESLALGVSPRGSLALLRAARAHALADGRDGRAALPLRSRLSEPRRGRRGVGGHPRRIRV